MDRYQILKGYQNNQLTIGFGSYGQVKLAKDLKTGKIVAIKIIYKIAKSEVLVHSQLNHPNIVNLIDIQIDFDREITYMILEYADEGNLYDKIKRGQLTKTEIKKYFKQICQGLGYLHQQHIMHRDIKPQNILITKNNQVKLCDFGVATLVSERRTLCGTCEYMAPEIIQNKPYDYKIDVWALGILLFEMIAGHAPFKGDRPDLVLEQMKMKIYFCDNFDDQDINLIKNLLRVNPSKRPEVAELLKHSYFTSYQNQQKISSTTYQDSSNGNSYQLSCQSLSQKQMFVHKRIQVTWKKQTYPPFYISQVNQHRKASKTQSFYGECKEKQKKNQMVPSFIRNSRKFIKSPRIDSCPNITKGDENISETSYFSPFNHKKQNKKLDGLHSSKVKKSKV